jgi:hypothetical protein
MANSTCRVCFFNRNESAAIYLFFIHILAAASPYWRHQQIRDDGNERRIKKNYR